MATLERSQRTRAVLTFFAQDHASTEMVYANADITKAEQAQEIIAFADHRHATTGTDPGLLVFDSQLTNYTVLNELTQRGLTWLTLRNLRTYHPALIDAGFADLDLPIPWWSGRRVRFRFPPR